MRDYVEQLFSADTVDEIWAMHVVRMGNYGFDRMIYGRSFGIFNRSEPSSEDISFFSNLPDDYNVRLQEDRLFAYSPMAAWDKSKSGTDVHRWDGSRAVMSGAKAREAVALNRQFKVGAGYTITFGATLPSGYAGIALVARADLDGTAIKTIWDVHGSTITLMNRLFHLRVSGMPTFGNGRDLSHRQREVLRLVANGYTTAEIATRLQLSPVTVEKHLRLARQQLGAATSVQAVLKAAIQHHILIGDN